jgi:hypothetical protein
MEPSELATVILVATAVILASSFAFWSGGLVTSFQKFEKIEINAISCYLQDGENGAYWVISVSLKNSGPKPATLTSVYLNQVEMVEKASPPSDKGISSDLPLKGYCLNSGESVSFALYVDCDYEQLSSGTSVQVRFHSAAGMDYIKLVILV